MNYILSDLYKAEILTLIDIHFAGFITEIADKDDSDLALAAALASNATVLKHVCLDLDFFSDKVLLNECGPSGPLRCPSALMWRRKLFDSRVVGVPGEELPLILDNKNRLYLYRYWKYEQTLAQGLLKKVNQPEFKIDPKRLYSSLDRFFPESEDVTLIPYRIAMITACIKRLCIIAGGPGTGKTSTAAKILAALLEQPGNETIRIALAAPTGKSAIRLGESIRMIKSGLHCSDWIKEAIPSEPQTIHRLLRPLSKSSQSFYHNANRPLPVDVVVVDEASMVDLSLMSKLIQAIPKNARLILIGDKDQLASVEPGSVFGDICRACDDSGYPDAWQTRLELLLHKSFAEEHREEVTTNKIGSCRVNLNKNFRFKENTDIQILCETIRRGDVPGLVRIFNDPGQPNITFHEIDPKGNWIEDLETNMIEGCRDYLQASDPESALEKFNRFKI